MRDDTTVIFHARCLIPLDTFRNFVWENETLEKVGRTTGWSSGSVEDTCTDYSSSISGEPDWTKLCSDRVDFAIQGGDSGSPVFYWKPDGTVELRGIVFGWQGCFFPIC